MLAIPSTPPSRPPSNWNTWNAERLNAVSRIPERIEVRFKVYDAARAILKDRFSCCDVRKFGCRQPEGGYFEIEFAAEELLLRCQFASQQDQFIWLITPLGGKEQIKLGIEAAWTKHTPGQISRQENEIQLTSGNQNHRLSFVGRITREHLSGAANQGEIWFDSTAPLMVGCNQWMTPAEMSAFLARRKGEYLSKAVAGGGYLGTSPTRMINETGWHTVYNQSRQRRVMTSSRQPGDSPSPSWDPLLASLSTAIQEPDFAWASLVKILEDEDSASPAGTPGCGTNTSQFLAPFSYFALKLFRQTGSLHQLRACFPTLLARSRAWKGCWQLSQPEIEAGIYPAEKSPVQAEPDLEMGQKSLYATELWALAVTATELGEKTIARELNEDYQNAIDPLQRRFLHLESALSLGSSREGDFNSQKSIANYFPLLAGAASPEQARQYVNQHPMDEVDGQAGELFLAVEGLKRCGLYDAAHRLARKSLSGYLNSASASYKTGTPILAFLGLSELIEAQPWGGIRIGNLSEEEACLEGFHWQNHLVSVKTGRSTRVWIDGRLFLQSDTPILITDMQLKGQRCHFQVESNQPSVLVLFPGAGIQQGKVTTRVQAATFRLSGHPVPINLP